MCIAAIYYVMNLRRISQSQKTQLVLNMATMNTHKEYMKQYSDVVHHYQWKNYDEWAEKYSGVVNPEAHATLLAEMNKLVYSGTLLHEKLVDPNLLYSYSAPTRVILTWEKIGPIIKRWRELYNDPKLGYYAEYLYDETLKRFPDVRVPSLAERYPSLVSIQKS